MARPGSTPNVQQAAFHGLGQATGVFAGFGGWQAKGGPEYVECGVGFWVKQGEKILFRSGQQDFMPTAKSVLARLLHRKVRICFGLVVRHERLGKGAKSG